MMIKNKIFLFLIAMTLISCEKDDFCTKEVVTPKVIIKFKRVIGTIKDSLTVWGINKDSLYTKSVLDSISIPLDAINMATTYKFSITKDSISALKFAYETEEEFISRSCGYGIVFKNIEITEEPMTKSWIDSISTTKISTLKNQKNAHITIYY